MNCVMKSRRCVRKEGKETGRKGYISLTWLLGQQVHGAEWDSGSGPGRTWQDSVDLAEYGRIR
jgi:hypothetical protein